MEISPSIGRQGECKLPNSSDKLSDESYFDSIENISKSIPINSWEVENLIETCRRKNCASKGYAVVKEYLEQLHSIRATWKIRSDQITWLTNNISNHKISISALETSISQINQSLLNCCERICSLRRNQANPCPFFYDGHSIETPPNTFMSHVTVCDILRNDARILNSLILFSSSDICIKYSKQLYVILCPAIDPKRFQSMLTNKGNQYALSSDDLKQCVLIHQIFSKFLEFEDRVYQSWSDRLSAHSIEQYNDNLSKLATLRLPYKGTLSALTTHQLMWFISCLNEYKTLEAEFKNILQLPLVLNKSVNSDMLRIGHTNFPQNLSTSKGQTVEQSPNLSMTTQTTEDLTYTSSAVKSQNPPKTDQIFVDSQLPDDIYDFNVPLAISKTNRKLDGKTDLAPSKNSNHDQWDNNRHIPFFNKMPRINSISSQLSSLSSSTSSPDNNNNVVNSQQLIVFKSDNNNDNIEHISAYKILKWWKLFSPKVFLRRRIECKKIVGDIVNQIFNRVWNIVGVKIHRRDKLILVGAAVVIQKWYRKIRYMPLTMSRNYYTTPNRPLVLMDNSTDSSTFTTHPKDHVKTSHSRLSPMIIRKPRRLNISETNSDKLNTFSLPNQYLETSSPPPPLISPTSSPKFRPGIYKLASDSSSWNSNTAASSKSNYLASKIASNSQPQNFSNSFADKPTNIFSNSSPTYYSSTLAPSKKSQAIKSINETIAVDKESKYKSSVVFSNFALNSKTISDEKARLPNMISTSIKIQPPISLVNNQSDSSPLKNYRSTKQNNFTPITTERLQNISKILDNDKHSDKTAENPSVLKIKSAKKFSQKQLTAVKLIQFWWRNKVPKMRLQRRMLLAKFIRNLLDEKVFANVWRAIDINHENVITATRRRSAIIIQRRYRAWKVYKRMEYKMSELVKRKIKSWSNLEYLVRRVRVALSIYKYIIRWRTKLRRRPRSILRARSLIQAYFLCVYLLGEKRSKPNPKNVKLPDNRRDIFKAVYLYVSPNEKSIINNLVQQRYERQSVTIQKYVRRFLVCGVWKKEKAKRLLAGVFTTFYARMKYLRVKRIRIKAAIQIQSIFRGYSKRLLLLRLTKSAILISRLWRKHVALRHFKHSLRRIERPYSIKLHRLHDVPPHFVNYKVKVRVSIWWGPLLHIVSTNEYESIMKVKKPQFVYISSEKEVISSNPTPSQPLNILNLLRKTLLNEFNTQSEQTKKLESLDEEATSKESIKPSLKSSTKQLVPEMTDYVKTKDHELLSSPISSPSTIKKGFNFDLKNTNSEIPKSIKENKTVVPDEGKHRSILDEKKQNSRGSKRVSLEVLKPSQMLASIYDDSDEDSMIDEEEAKPDLQNSMPHKETKTSSQFLNKYGKSRAEAIASSPRVSGESIQKPSQIANSNEKPTSSLRTSFIKAVTPRGSSKDELFEKSFEEAGFNRPHKRTTFTTSNPASTSPTPRNASINSVAQSNVNDSVSTPRRSLLSKLFVRDQSASSSAEKNADDESELSNDVGDKLENDRGYTTYKSSPTGSIRKSINSSRESAQFRPSPLLGREISQESTSSISDRRNRVSFRNNTVVTSPRVSGESIQKPSQIAISNEKPTSSLRTSFIKAVTPRGSSKDELFEKSFEEAGFNRPHKRTTFTTSNPASTSPTPRNASINSVAQSNVNDSVTTPRRSLLSKLFVRDQSASSSAEKNADDESELSNDDDYSTYENRESPTGSIRKSINSSQVRVSNKERSITSSPRGSGESIQKPTSSLRTSFIKAVTPRGSSKDELFEKSFEEAGFNRPHKRTTFTTSNPASTSPTPRNASINSVAQSNVNDSVTTPRRSLLSKLFVRDQSASSSAEKNADDESELSNDDDNSTYENRESPTGSIRKSINSSRGSAHNSTIINSRDSTSSQKNRRTRVSFHDTKINEDSEPVRSSQLAIEKRSSGILKLTPRSSTKDENIEKSLVEAGFNRPHKRAVINSKPESTLSTSRNASINSVTQGSAINSATSPQSSLLNKQFTRDEEVNTHHDRIDSQVSNDQESDKFLSTNRIKYSENGRAALQTPNRQSVRPRPRAIAQQRNNEGQQAEPRRGNSKSRTNALNDPNFNRPHRQTSIDRTKLSTEPQLSSSLTSSPKLSLINPANITNSENNSVAKHETILKTPFGFESIINSIAPFSSNKQSPQSKPSSSGLTASPKLTCEFNEYIRIPACHGNSLIRFEFIANDNDLEMKLGEYAFGMKEEGDFLYWGGEYSKEVLMKDIQKKAKKRRVKLGTTDVTVEKDSANVTPIQKTLLHFAIIPGAALRSKAQWVHVKCQGSSQIRSRLRTHNIFYDWMFNPWERIFCSLDRDKLYFYDDRFSTSPKAILDISSIKQIRIEAGESLQFMQFDDESSTEHLYNIVISTAKETLYLRVPDPPSRVAWYEALNVAISMLVLETPEPTDNLVSGEEDVPRLLSAKTTTLTAFKSSANLTVTVSPAGRLTFATIKKPKDNHILPKSTDASSRP